MGTNIFEETTFAERRNIIALAKQWESKTMAKAAGPVVRKDENGQALLTTDQAARMLQTSTWAIRQHLKAGTLKGHQDKEGKKAWHVLLSSVTELKESLKQAKPSKSSNFQTECKECHRKKPNRWMDVEMGVCLKCLDKETAPTGEKNSQNPPPKEGPPKRKPTLEEIFEPEKHKPITIENIAKELQPAELFSAALSQNKSMLLLEAFAAQMEAQALFMRVLVNILK